MLVRASVALVYNTTLFPLALGLARLRRRNAFGRPRTLRLDLSDLPTTSPSGRFSRHAGPAWPGFARILRAAAAESGVKGLFVVLDGADGSLVEFDSLREALAQFAESGKDVRVHFEGLDGAGALVATAAHRVTLAPGGGVLLRRLSGETRFYGHLLGQLGVHVDTAHAGAFKGIVEPFSRSEPSEAFRQATQETLADIDSLLVDRLSASAPHGQPRDWSAAAEQAPILSRTAARSAGVVDELAYRDAEEAAIDAAEQSKAPLREWIRRRTQPKHKPDPRLMALYQAPLVPPRPRPFRAPGLVAVAALSGMIVEDERLPSRGPVVIGREWAEQFDALRQDDRVRAVVIAIDSRGGSATASDRIWHAVHRLAAAKPTVAWMRDVAASGGYYIAAGARHIIASPFTLTGSIGVAWLKPTFGPAARRHGVRVFEYGAERGATLGSATRTLSESDRAAVQASIEESYQRFLEVVATSRNLPEKHVAEVAQGRVWTGRQALDRRLVDELGGFEAVEQWIRAQLGLSADANVQYGWTGQKPMWQRAAQLLDRFTSTSLRSAGPGADLADLARGAFLRSATDWSQERESWLLLAESHAAHSVWHYAPTVVPARL